MTELSKHQVAGSISRRGFLGATSAAAIGLPLVPTLRPCRADSHGKRLKVAALFTVFAYRSHAHVILENFLEKYLFNGKLTDPGVDVVSFYAAQMPDKDMSVDVAKQYGIPMYPTIDKALCLGGKTLAVDAVLSIAEHGNYPVNKLAQKQYPRKEFFDQIVEVLKRSKRYVPVFNDKHLSYRWDWAKQMYDTTQMHGIPFMAGSSVPLAQRIPPMAQPDGRHFEAAVSIHGGGVESYDIHGLEVLQSMVESRHGGETGVKSVTFLDSDALVKAVNGNPLTRQLIEKAMAAETDKPLPDDLRFGGVKPHGIQVDHKDGLSALMVKIGGSGIRWNFACKFKDDPKLRATRFHVGPWRNRNLFKALSHAIQNHFIHKKSPYPVERTLLTTGIVEAAMRSRVQSGKTLTTDHLHIAYEPRDFTAMREMGASWKIITDETPQLRGMHKMNIRP